MTDRLVRIFDFSGRLSFAGRARLERKLLLIAALGIAGPIFLFMVDAPPLAGAAAALLIVPVAIGSVAANVRRLHDVGQDAHRVYLKRLVWWAIVAAPVAVAIYRPDLPEQVRWGMTGTSGLAALIGLFIRDLTWTEWLRGEPGPNRFGPAPE
jgi:uncharacterized membrane protein YhaH (DUF805 family)